MWCAKLPQFTVYDIFDRWNVLDAIFCPSNSVSITTEGVDFITSHGIAPVSVTP